MAENVITDEIAVAGSTADVQERKNKSKKLTVLITYLITVLCLLAGLLVPLFNWGFGTLSERMLLRYLPSMLDNVLAPFAKKQLIPASIPWFINVYTGKFDLASLACVLYALLTIVSLFMIIPVCLGKKHRKTSVTCALAVEISAVIITVVYASYTVFQLANAVSGLAAVKWIDYNFVIAFGGALIASVIQSVLYNGSIGVSKTVGIILSVFAVIALLDITAFIPALSKPLTDLTVKTNGKLAAGFVGGIELSTGMGIDGLAVIYSLFTSKSALSTVFGSGAAIGTAYVLIIALAVLTVLNAVCDAIGLATGKKFRKNGAPCKNFGDNIFTLVRYGVTFVFALILVLLAVFRKDLAPGLFLCVFTVIVFFQLINALVRLLVANARVKKAAAYTAGETETTVVADPGFIPSPAEEPVYAQPVYEQPAYEQPSYEQPVYNQPVYEQPADTQPVYEQPVYEQTTFEQPSYEQPVYEDPVYEQPSFDRSAYERSAYERPSYDRSSFYRQPAYEQPTFEDLSEDEPEVKEAEVKPESKPEAKPAEQPAPAPAPAPVPETVYVYGGDTDEFMDTLTDKEKVEFVEVFLKKTKGTVNGVPDYCIKGDNSDFFPAVFVHINRYRDKLSDALMGKMYKQLGK